MDDDEGSFGDCFVDVAFSVLFCYTCPSFFVLLVWSNRYNDLVHMIQRDCTNGTYVIV
jgi:hypothetical protein